MSTDDRHNDQELKAYLDGRDGVSAAYRKTAQEEPPRALDHAILEAARKQHQPSTEAWYSSRKPYAIAASLMVAVVATSLYFGTIDEFVAPVAEQQEDFIAVRLERARDEAGTAAESEAAPEESQALTLEAPAFRARELAPAVPAVGAADSAAAAAPPAGLSADALVRAAEAPAIVIDGPRLEAIEAEAERAQQTQQRTEEQRRQGAAEAELDNELEEITVTGSRITRRDADDVSYREAREDWLQVMRVMSDELADLRRRTGNTVFQERQLQDEMDLYMEAYPDADLEAELEALEE